MKNFFVIIMLAVSIPCLAIVNYWTNGDGDRDFNNGLNWLDVPADVVWTADDDFYIDSADPDSPILNGDLTGGDVRLGTIGVPADFTIAGGVSSFTTYQHGFAADSDTQFFLTGGDVTVSGYFTVGNQGEAYCEISGGSLYINRGQLAQNPGSTGSFLISGGSFTSETYFRTWDGTGTITATGGTITAASMAFGDGDVGANGTFSVSGTAEVNVSGSMLVGDEGYGVIDLSGGSISADTLTAAGQSNPESQGEINISGGSFDVTEFFTIGNSGTASANVSDGVLNVNRMMLAQSSTADAAFNLTGGEVNILGGYLTVGSSGLATLDISGGALNGNRLNIGVDEGGNGTVALSGGQLNIETYIEVGRDGTAKFSILGDAAGINSESCYFGPLSTTEMALNGSAGIGSGIQACGFNEGIALIYEGAVFDPYFMTGTDAAGQYLAAASSEPMTYYAAGVDPELEDPALITGDISDMLSTAAVSAGWSAEIVGAGSGTAIILTSPVAGTSQVWNSGADTLNSSATVDTAIVGDDAAASLAVTTGADAACTNLTIAAQGTSVADVSMDGGSVNVASTMVVGDEGNAALAMSGGTLSAGHLIAASGETSEAYIELSGSANLNVDGLLAIGENADMMVSGTTTAVNAKNLTAAEGSNMTFQLDSALGIGNGIVLSGNAVLEGTITPEFIGERPADGVYTLIRAEGSIYVGDSMDIDNVFVSYEVVEAGDYNELQVTFFTPESCEDVIATGFALVGDLNEDCEVNLQDVAVMSTKWLLCNDPDPNRPECDWQIK
ncbi:hypothetical protein SMSP2_01514 [Limihaloglobus sulfuriphilus]|uniref:Uncharacterized protein n=1 Tax=Limihaloglobus sulfuriphilus TaxID=1851148 RepID=A0A1Q2MER7_9BACT|nr:hypothetical protein [Limihaloglobus sulfuriphilus]AQQ71149.1 hypothetical protein SMSP2_01514 [Limihaloglobus sulfuriphilus]